MTGKSFFIDVYGFLTSLSLRTPGKHRYEPTKSKFLGPGAIPGLNPKVAKRSFVREHLLELANQLPYTLILVRALKPSYQPNLSHIE